MTGKEDLIRMILAGHMTAQTVTERTVLVDGDAGVVFGTAELKFQAPGESESVSLLRYTATYVKRAGHWRAIAIHMSKRTAP
jgi:ketosteroid isomerase-like protein